MSRYDWMDDAACASHNPDTWFPSVTGKGGLAQVETATKVCRDCPVSAQCAAMASGSAYGVWAGRYKGKPKSQGTSGGGPRKAREIA